MTPINNILLKKHIITSVNRFIRLELHIQTSLNLFWRMTLHQRLLFSCTIIDFLIKVFRCILGDSRILKAFIKFNRFYHVSHNICVVNSLHVYLFRKSTLNFKSINQLVKCFPSQIPTGFIVKSNILAKLVILTTKFMNFI